MNELGKISLDNNDRSLAKQYFQAAAGGAGQVANEAALAYTLLDIEDAPSSYIQVQAYTDAENRLLARVMNRSGIALENIQLEFTAVLGDQLAEQSVRLASLAINQTVNLNSGLRFPDGVQASANQMRVRVIAASPQ